MKIPSFLQLYHESDPINEKLLTIENKTTTLFNIFLATFLALFFVVESWFEQNKPRFGHTSAVIVMIGIAFSSIIWNISNKFTEDLNLTPGQKDAAKEELGDKLNFGYHFFFALILPLIVFPSGFNMRRKKFFKNI